MKNDTRVFETKEKKSMVAHYADGYSDGHSAFYLVVNQCHAFFLCPREVHKLDSIPFQSYFRCAFDFSCESELAEPWEAQISQIVGESVEINESFQP